MTVFHAVGHLNLCIGLVRREVVPVGRHCTNVTMRNKQLKEQVTGESESASSINLQCYTNCIYKKSQWVFFLTISFPFRLVYGYYTYTMWLYIVIEVRAVSNTLRLAVQWYHGVDMTQASYDRYNWVMLWITVVVYFFSFFVSFSTSPTLFLCWLFGENFAFHIFVG